MRIVGGAVKRINVPAEFGSRSALVSRSLFGRNGMIRKVLSELLDDEPLRALVSLCNEIYFVPFVANVEGERQLDRKSTRLNSSHGYISYAVFCLKQITAVSFMPITGR